VTVSDDKVESWEAGRLRPNNPARRNHCENSD
jgi:DNA-binding transcriptional regulator YiaG